MKIYQLMRKLQDEALTLQLGIIYIGDYDIIVVNREVTDGPVHASDIIVNHYSKQVTIYTDL